MRRNDWCVLREIIFFACLIDISVDAAVPASDDAPFQSLRDGALQESGIRGVRRNKRNLVHEEKPSCSRSPMHAPHFQEQVRLDKTSPVGCSSLSAFSSCNNSREQSKHARRSSTQPAGRWARHCPAPVSRDVKFYMHIACAAFSALFKAFIAMPYAQTPVKRRRLSVESRSVDIWTLCFSDGGAESCPDLVVRRLDNVLQQKWRAGSGGLYWREICESDINSTGTREPPRISRLYGAFSSKDNLTQVATLVRRLFILRCSNCSRQPASRAQGSATRLPTRQQHRVVALLAEAACREATERCCAVAPPHLIHDTRIPACTRASPAAGKQQGDEKQPALAHGRSADLAAAGPIEEALLRAQSSFLPCNRQHLLHLQRMQNLQPTAGNTTQHSPAAAAPAAALEASKGCTHAGMAATTSHSDLDLGVKSIEEQLEAVVQMEGCVCVGGEGQEEEEEKGGGWEAQEEVEGISRIETPQATSVERLTGEGDRGGGEHAADVAGEQDKLKERVTGGGGSGGGGAHAAPAGGGEEEDMLKNVIAALGDGLYRASMVVGAILVY